MVKEYCGMMDEEYCGLMDKPTNKHQGNFTEKVADNSKSTSFTRKQMIVLVSACIGDFFAYIGVSFPSPFLPQLDEQHNINAQLTGWILGLFSLVQLLMCIVFGKLMHSFGVRATFLFGLLSCGAFMALFGFLAFAPLPDDTDQTIDVTFLVLAIVIRSGHAVGSAAVATASMTLLTAEFPHDTMTVLAYGETAIGIGVLSGPAIGSGLFKLGGFVLAFSGIGGLIIACAVITWFLLPRGIQENAKQEERASLAEIFSNINVVIALILAASTGLMFACINPLLEPELREKYGLTPDVSALTFILVSACYAITAPLIGKLLDKFKHLNLLNITAFGYVLATFNFMFMGPTPLFFGLQRPLWLLLVTLAVLGVFTGIVVIPSMKLSFVQSNTEEQTTTQLSTSTKAMISGLWISAFAFGEFVAQILSGMIVEHTNFAWTMTVYAFISLASLLPILLVKAHRFLRRKRKTKEEYKPLIKQASDESVNSYTNIY